MTEKFTITTTGKTYSECKLNALALAGRMTGDTTATVTETVMPDSNMWRLDEAEASYDSRPGFGSVIGNFTFSFRTGKEEDV